MIQIHKEEELSFKNVITFNLDEYYPIKSSNPLSYFDFMNKHLFDHIDIDLSNVHIPNGNISIDQIEKYCEEYENKITQAGGLDF